MNIGGSEFVLAGNRRGDQKVKSRAIIRIFGAPLDFDLIASHLGVQPSRVHRMGDTLGPGGPFAHDLWSIGSPLDRSEPMDKHLLSLKQILKPHYDFLRSLKEEAQVRSFCGVVVDGEECTIQLSAEALGIFVELDIDLELSLILLGNGGPNKPEEPEIKGSSLGMESKPDLKESRVILTLRGQEMNLERTSATLGITPSETHCAGELDPSGRPYPIDAWSLVVPVDSKEEPDGHLRWVAHFLSQHAEFIRLLGTGADVHVHCVFRTASDNGGFAISPAALRVPVELAATLAITAQLI